MLCEFPPNEYAGLHVWLTDQVDTILLSAIENDSIFGYWQTFYTEVQVSTWSNPKDSVQILFSARDTTTGSNSYYLKAHIDRFRLIEGGVAVEDINDNKKHLVVFPNPVYGSTVYFKDDVGLEGNEFSIVLVDSYGREIYSSAILRSELSKGISLNLADGIYFLNWKTDKDESGIEKIVILRK